MNTSNLYVKCPKCADTTLIQHVRGNPEPVTGGASPSFRPSLAPLAARSACSCAACAYDYGELAKDRPRFEAYLADRMREGPMGQLGAIALHQWLSGLGTQDHVREIRAIALRNGILLPDAADAGATVKQVLIAAAVLAVLIAGLGVFAFLR